MTERNMEITGDAMGGEPIPNPHRPTGGAPPPPPPPPGPPDDTDEKPPAPIPLN